MAPHLLDLLSANPRRGRPDGSGVQCGRSRNSFAAMTRASDVRPSMLNLLLQQLDLIGRQVKQPIDPLVQLRFGVGELPC